MTIRDLKQNIYNSTDAKEIDRMIHELGERIIKAYELKPLLFKRLRRKNEQQYINH